VKKGNGVVFLQRHGSPPMPPHRIGHRANIAALKELGVHKIVAVNSVGSLKLSLEPGTLLVPDDFVSPWHVETFFDDEMRFMIPVMDGNFAHEVFVACREHTMAVRMGGTYVETIGPRLETKAEINVLKGFGDIVGMTLASEATLAMEMDLPYASICSIDNYCHGIVEVPLTMDEIRANVSRNLSTIETVLNSLITRGLS
jgi:5'-methylthioadenosine phosphorylase